MPLNDTTFTPADARRAVPAYKGKYKVDRAYRVWRGDVEVARTQAGSTVQVSPSDADGTRHRHELVKLATSVWDDSEISDWIWLPEVERWVAPR